MRFIERIRKIGWSRLKLKMLAKSTSQKGARVIAKERQSLQPSREEFVQALLGVAGQAASKIRFAQMPYEERRHEAFMAILSKLKDVAPAANPEGYAYSVAKHHLLNLCRHADIGVKRIGEFSTTTDKLENVGKEVIQRDGIRGRDAAHGAEEYTGDGWSESAAYASALRSAYHAGQLLNALSDGLATLSAREQNILRMFYHDELRLEAIAERVDGGITVDYTKELKRGALDKLRHHLTTLGYNV